MNHKDFTSRGQQGRSVAVHVCRARVLRGRDSVSLLGFPKDVGTQNITASEKTTDIGKGIQHLSR